MVHPASTFPPVRRYLILSLSCVDSNRVGLRFTFFPPPPFLYRQPVDICCWQFAQMARPDELPHSRRKTGSSQSNPGQDRHYTTEELRNRGCTDEDIAFARLRHQRQQYKRVAAPQRESQRAAATLVRGPEEEGRVGTDIDDGAGRRTANLAPDWDPSPATTIMDARRTRTRDPKQDSGNQNRRGGRVLKPAARPRTRPEIIRAARATVYDKPAPKSNGNTQQQDNTAAFRRKAFRRPSPPDGGNTWTPWAAAGEARPASKKKRRRVDASAAC